MRLAGFNPQQYGDLCIGIVAARAAKQRFPDAHLTYVIAKDYAQIAPLFLNNPHIDGIYITHKSRDGFDEQDMTWFKQRGFEAVFDPMADHDHSRPWWRARHQAIEAAYMHGLDTTDSQIELTQWFDVELKRDWVAFSPFAGAYNPKNDKRLSVEHAQEIVNLIRVKGFKVLQIGGPGEPALEGTSFPTLSYFEAMRAILGCKCLVHTDTGFGWAASAYRFPQLGLYSNAYYTRQFVKHIQPISSRALYLDEANVNTISLDSVGQALDTLLS